MQGYTEVMSVEEIKPGQFVQQGGSWLRFESVNLQLGHIKLADYFGVTHVIRLYSIEANVMVNGTPKSWAPGYLRDMAKKRQAKADQLYREAAALRQTADAIRDEVRS